jgi:hypothetical protein
MAWTTPYTYTPGETLTAAKLNTMEDNFTYLKSQTDLLYVTVYNNDGSTLNQGDVVVWDKSYTAAVAVKTTTYANDPRVAGIVVSSSISSGATGVIARGDAVLYANINCAGVVTFGHSLVTSTTAHYAADSGGFGFAPTGCCGIATASKGAGNGQVMSLVKIKSEVFGTAVNYEGSNNAYTNSSASQPGSVNVQCGTNPNRLIVAAVFMWATNSYSTPLTPTVGGSNMTQIGATQNLALNGLSKCALWYYIAPATGLVGCVGGGFTSSSGYMTAITMFLAYSGILQASPARTLGFYSGNTSSIAVSCSDAQVGDEVAAFASIDMTTDASGIITGGRQTGQTQRDTGSTPGSNGSFWTREDGDDIIATAANQQATWTLSAAKDTGALIVPLKPY